MVVGPLGQQTHLIPPILTFMLGTMQSFFKVSTLHFSGLAYNLLYLDTDCMVTNPFNQRTSICCEVGHASRFLQRISPDSGWVEGPNEAR